VNVYEINMLQFFCGLLSIKRSELGVVVHAYNHSYLAGRGGSRRIGVRS
jgi:hypothetical protein